VLRISMKKLNHGKTLSNQLIPSASKNCDLSVQRFIF
jgi:hypothetical protein